MQERGRAKLRQTLCASAGASGWQCGMPPALATTGATPPARSSTTIRTPSRCVTIHTLSCLIPCHIAGWSCYRCWCHRPLMQQCTCHPQDSCMKLHGKQAGCRAAYRQHNSPHLQLQLHLQQSLEPSALPRCCVKPCTSTPAGLASAETPCAAARSHSRAAQAIAASCPGPGLNPMNDAAAARPRAFAIRPMCECHQPASFIR